MLFGPQSLNSATAAATPCCVNHYQHSPRPPGSQSTHTPKKILVPEELTLQSDWILAPLPGVGWLSLSVMSFLLSCNFTYMYYFFFSLAEDIDVNVAIVRTPVFFFAIVRLCVERKPSSNIQQDAYFDKAKKKKTLIRGNSAEDITTYHCISVNTHIEYNVDVYYVPRYFAQANQSPAVYILGCRKGKKKKKNRLGCKLVTIIHPITPRTTLGSFQNKCQQLEDVNLYPGYRCSYPFRQQRFNA